ncbi:hypothetical protein OsJ_11516 [Oryza sativa Japonica Group]|uniref:SWIM-type domain-containing protein n=1 Tax=Oryza sativa subsp. japonica TaxID=39947 RepID=B9F9E3_ORYSJ|nr:hypothetical protein OsJ_11516 [Oryza sativa Japonica Group]
MDAEIAGDVGAGGERITQKVDDKVVQTLIVPQVGMSFESKDKAYEMYNTYAGKVGFSIRKSNVKRRSNGTIYQKHMVCNKQGQQETSSSLDTTRTCCKARVQFSVCRKEIWMVQKVVLEHNHDLVSPNKSHKLRSQRRVIEADRQLIGQIREAGMKPAQVYGFMKEWYGGADKVPFSKMDCNNEIGRERKKYLESNDTQTLLEYLRNKQLEDPTFFYAIQVDKEDGRIANFFWADGQSIMDYACFGDFVSFDTTFDTNKCEMPFAPLLGTNHHKQTIIFGAALLFNQTIESFVWLFETFLTAMSGKHPSTIFTDQDAAMAAAIAFVFRNTSHRLCLWHIYLNGGKNLSHVIHKHPNKFLADFKRCVYEDRSEYYFNKMWHELLSEYNLEDNKWISNLYKLREKWAIVFRNSFTADITSTQRSEGMNNVYKKRFRRKLGLSELLVECDKVSATLRENELDADFKSRHSNPVTYIPNLPMLKIAAESYTRSMYSELEDEFKQQFTLSCKLLKTEGATLTFVVMPMEYDHEATVVFNPTEMTITCSCRKYECIGLLCKHALRVFNMNKVFTLPSHYILNRWTKYAKSGFYIQKQGSEKETLKAHAARISRHATSVELKCSVSKELLDDLEQAINKLDLEADNSLSKMQEKSCEVPLNSNGCVKDTLNGTISFLVPRVVKGPKSRRSKDVVEKKKWQKKFEDPNNASENRDEDAGDVYGQSSTMDANDMYGQSSTMVANDVYGESSTMPTPLIQGGYTNLLFEVQQDCTFSSSARKLHFPMNSRPFQNGFGCVH